MNNLKNDELVLDDLKYVELDEKQLELYKLYKGDLVFNRTNSKEKVGKCEVFEADGDWIFASYLIRLIANQDQVLPQFVADYLRSPVGRLQIDQLSRQIIGMTNINAEEIKVIKIPVPEKIEVQKALVDSMDKARADRRAKLAEADEALGGLDKYLMGGLGLVSSKDDDRSFFAVSAQEATGRFDPHFHLPSHRSNVAMLVNAGAVPLGSIIQFSNEVWKPAHHESATFRYIEISNVNPKTGEAIAEETMVAEAPSRARMVVRTNDIIVSLTRPHHGSIAQVNADLNGAVASTGFSILRGIDEQLVNRDYLWCVLRSRICLQQMLQRATGGNYPAITEAELGKVLVPLPKMSVQERIAAEALHRRALSSLLRSEAEVNWQSTKEWFEMQLLQASGS